ncbi:ImmA/IrrE family metallo-endopeptidase [Methanobrevibacter sp.]|uniref:ImmA/IrrE family metallo-endopeptidase n=1 Tax=Methanobrevibacter sp. TaxID=66852 RepID=UPI002E78F083|nr:ImmA/IrrE family metallo-endopeptidase [Methanobrevibacter sp.]MEE0024846.1 ImmA/IrrE family metallo-endopeptidase [Methanobrevibacter sp.]
MKNCDVCGTFNLDENNYCTHCGCRIVNENICPFCGVKNPDSSNVCINCHKQITPIAIDSFDVLFSDYNRSLLLNPNFSVEDYFNILKSMFKKLDYIEISGKTPKEKVLQIANVFTPVIPKSNGLVYGEYGSPVIFYDDRLDESLQISTIIHELAHFLLFDLSVNILCEILDIAPSPVIKSFIDHFLIDSEVEIINEFYAHSVENRFIPLKYQDFNSFFMCISKLGFSADDVEDFIVLGNSLAHDIIFFLQKYIDDNLRESIKLQFKIDMNEPNTISFNYNNDILPHEKKNTVYIGLMVYYFEVFYLDKEARGELEYTKYKYED